MVPPVQPAEGDVVQPTGLRRALEGFRRGVALCLDLGYEDGEIRKMVSTNAARVLGLEALLAADPQAGRP